MADRVLPADNRFASLVADYMIFLQGGHFSAEETDGLALNVAYKKLEIVVTCAALAGDL